MIDVTMLLQITYLTAMQYGGILLVTSYISLMTRHGCK